MYIVYLWTYISKPTGSCHLEELEKAIPIYVFVCFQIYTLLYNVHIICIRFLPAGYRLQWLRSYKGNLD